MIKFILLKTQVAIRQVGGIQKVDQMLDSNPDYWFAVDSDGLALVTRTPKKLDNIIFATRTRIESYQGLHKLIQDFVAQMPRHEQMKYLTLIGES